MAGTTTPGESADNPVAINATAMVDVIFCLCLFFMCSMHFKQLEGKIETWLPREAGGPSAMAEKINLEEIRIVIQWDARAAGAVRRVGNRPPAASDSELLSAVLDMTADYQKLGKKDFPVLLDVARDVPWREVVHVMDLCKQQNLERIEFTAPPVPAATGKRA